MRTRGAGAAMLTALAIALAGCTGAAAPEPAATVGAGTSSATVDKGDTVLVHLGEWSSGVGDAWVLTEEPDPAVLAQKEPEPVSGDEHDGVGGSHEMTDTYEAVGPGEVTLNYEYRFRGEVPEDPARQMTQTYRIVVR
ncbi:protease inhibitor I42 family protein [Microbacterium sp. KUDC0406]|uniref:protease inhibitor I42 family protein n=1 Tax=Microbacterium sp. KUDC0406 TaxID=2909588 RepID=UPI001F400E69|nr:protease inhibitor I42 family protein [Microbacterium sp. KUDC0406]UJP09351.1 protease inhibitor I42 family protein [Microbacterium sp. KUDC0406]